MYVKYILSSCWVFLVPRWHFPSNAKFFFNAWMWQMAMMMSAMAAMMKGGKGGLRLAEDQFLETDPFWDVRQNLILLKLPLFLTFGNVKICQGYMGHRSSMNTWNLKHIETSRPLGHPWHAFFRWKCWAEAKPGPKGGSKGPTGPQYGKGGRGWLLFSIPVGERVCNRNQPPPKIGSCRGFVHVNMLEYI